MPGGLLDTHKYFIILPDSIGHGKSSKPSDGLRAIFPHMITMTWLQLNMRWSRRV
jgi:homoserine acetyltransferase